MKALVLAAGRGSRLGDATDDRPKCLIEVEGSSLLHRQVRALRACADEIGVVTGWRAEAFDGLDLTRFHNPRWASTTMVESLAAATRWLTREPVIVSYGDIVYSAESVRRLATAGGDVAVVYDPDWEALWRGRFADPLADAETFRLDGDRVVEIGGRPTTTAEVQGQYTGLFRLTPHAWSVASATHVPGLDMTGLLSRLVRELTVTAVPVAGPWFEFDHPSDVVAGRGVLKALDEGT
ncbi:phosphocholine cytidylyltransferase family protein [Saccharothrix luteola]|uniref:phosphocholine cytidylyltransferase family protein n=1 Tax=Saccharothrix luteola TaxID=2893018 RepID=UPI001E546430|nr:phosphocholine cytidylyltransferase family protein [Saccharothrix luteola]MCC8243215.1 phosphocholine cytidylyltransferase family protein [Saccharothrix luteola]